MDHDMGTLPSPEKSSSDLKRVIEELMVKGRDAAAQLQMQLQKPILSEDRGTSFVSAEELVAEILRSFTGTLSVLNSNSLPGEVFQIPATSTGQVGSGSPSCCCDLRSVDSGESSKRPPAGKDRRVGYKRRKLTSESWTKVSASMEDGFGWRKYGQKDILNAKFPRCYFRCTYKNGQGCKAIKQVQRMKEEPPLYKTTYFERHTCRVVTDHPLLDCTDHDHDQYPMQISDHNHLLISFESKTIPSKNVPCSSSSSKLEEAKELEAQSDLSENISSLDSIDWREMALFDVASYLHFEESDDHDHFFSGLPHKY